MVLEGLFYTKSHEWIRDIGGGKYEVGLTDHAQSELGDIVFINLPQAGDEVTAGEAIADVESVKAVSDIYSPATGLLETVNDELADAPETINKDPYGAWLFTLSQVTDKEEWLTAADYERFLQEGE